MNILITGTDGFIGKNLKKSLKKHNILSINEDIFDNSNWIEDLQNKIWEFQPEVVYHVGACSNTLEQDVNYMMKLNYEFTKHLSDICLSLGIPLIYSSSAANYGTNGQYPSNLYGWSKYAAEDYVLSNGGIALRYFNVYGPGEEHKGKMASVAYQMYKKDKALLFPGNPKRDFIYIDDVVEANIFAFENFNQLLPSYYEVGSGRAETFETILNIMGINFEYLDKTLIPEGYQFYTCSNKEKWMPGWHPKYNLKKGLKKYLKYLNLSQVL
jgi:ADP-L-glycero-D-manno-heptose 6-epimerase